MFSQKTFPAGHRPPPNVATLTGPFFSLNDLILNTEINDREPEDAVLEGLPLDGQYDIEILNLRGVTMVLCLITYFYFY